MDLRVLTLLGAAASLASCTSMTEVDDGPLSGTEWKLVSFTSMDDSQGATRPSDGQALTIDFGADGTAAMQLDCNRGTASYQTEATGTGTGTLSFGPVAATRAMCPDPKLSDLMANQLPNVVSYMVADGKLSLALKMDGGIFEFEEVK